ncbi:DUF3576 domain-containing protein [Rhodobacterales bacterium HKCCE2091]|nr:DUF3576 domain-containing protein [Rhodobacterales bacterium HKCCE2091]
MNGPMQLSRITRLGVTFTLLAVLSACGGGGIGNLFGGGNRSQEEIRAAAAAQAPVEEPRETIWDLLVNEDDPNTTVEVNRYLWNATLEILDFMPIQAADPFSGVIVYGYGTPPGGGGAYRATVYITDPALDARSLRVAVQSRGGPVSRETARQIEDAILTRARQLRIRDSSL